MARIGLISIWFNRGQSFVTRTLRQALIDNGHECFVLARMGAVYGQNMQEKSGEWNYSGITYFPKYEIPPNALKIWAKSNRLDIVILNEEYQWDLPVAMHEIGVKTIQYLDFLGQSWSESLRHNYDQLWSATHRTTALLSDMGLSDMTTNIGWGIPDNMPYLGNYWSKYDFFSNQGWLGINLRKGVDLLIKAMWLMVACGLKNSLLIHAQAPMEMLPKEILDMASDLEHSGLLTWRTETVPPPGLYHLGKVVVQPSRLEGLGLTIPEAMWQGRPVVTTDAPPMNEFIWYPSARVPVESVSYRSDGLSFPECTADVDALAQAMQDVLTGNKNAGEVNRLRAIQLFSWSAFCSRIAKSLEVLGAH